MISLATTEPKSAKRYAAELRVLQKQHGTPKGARGLATAMFGESAVRVRDGETFGRSGFAFPDVEIGREVAKSREDVWLPGRWTITLSPRVVARGAEEFFIAQALGVWLLRDEPAYRVGGDPWDVAALIAFELTGIDFERADAMLVDRSNVIELRTCRVRAARGC